jgi:hypothetical protein
MMFTGLISDVGEILAVEDLPNLFAAQARA